MAGKIGEIHDDVRPFGRTQEERAAPLILLEDVPDIEQRRVEVPGNRLVRQHQRRRQETTFGPDLDEGGPRRGRIGHAAFPSVPWPDLRETACRVTRCIQVGAAEEAGTIATSVRSVTAVPTKS